MAHKAKWSFGLIAATVAVIYPGVGGCVIVPRDEVYIHCRVEGGDFRISDLNHTVFRYSDRYRKYRPVCPECTVAQWGDVISLVDGRNVSVWIDRLKGYVSVRNRDDGDDDAFDRPRTFQGACARGQIVNDRPPAPPHRLF